jgi:hypothetical protein
MSTNHLVNPDLIAGAYATLAGTVAKFAKATDKRAFVPGGDPSMDPAAAQQQQQQQPPAGGGGGEGGGTPPAMDPAAAAGGGGGGADPQAIAQATAQAIAPLMQGAGGGMGGAEPIKPKIDVNVTMLQILKILARIADALGVQIPASEMVATQGDLTSFANQQQAGAPGGAPGAAGGAAGGQSAIPPIQPMGAAAPGMGGGAAAGGAKMGAWENGSGFDSSGLGATSSKAAAAIAILNARKRAA